MMAVWLRALTAEARSALNGDAMAIDRLPFRVGRENRDPESSASWAGQERRSGTAPQANDLYLVEAGKIHNISREHFEIDWDGDGYFLTDRGSTCGTVVEGHQVGGHRVRQRVALCDHDVIIVGTSTSPFIFKFRIDGPS
jgi:pSer/pThr/pTyr-binding forkhead associated (FHA) protein